MVAGIVKQPFKWVKRQMEHIFGQKGHSAEKDGRSRISDLLFSEYFSPLLRAC